MKIGILGAGQLGRMLALAGYRLGWEFRVLDTRANTAMKVVEDSQVGDLLDPQTLHAFADGLDLVTYEFENVPATTVALLQDRVPVHPGAKALETAQDRLYEKTLFSDLGIPTTHFANAENEAALTEAAQEIGFPCVVKTRRLGYDGKGQKVLSDPKELEGVWESLGRVPLLIENKIPFDREVSQIIARSRTGEIACYPLTENHHRQGTLSYSIAPAASTSDTVAQKAAHYAKSLVEALDYVGVLAIEYFQVGDDLLANEFAPRVHNSGHWTMDAPLTCQFENHLRAICGLPLGNTSLPDARVYAMINLLSEMPPLRQLSEKQGLKLHLYGKEPRPGRKLGHLNLQASDRAFVESALQRWSSELHLSLA